MVSDKIAIIFDKLFFRKREFQFRKLQFPSNVTLAVKVVKGSIVLHILYLNPPSAAIQKTIFLFPALGKLF